MLNKPGSANEYILTVWQSQSHLAHTVCGRYGDMFVLGNVDVVSAPTFLSLVT